MSNYTTKVPTFGLCHISVKYFGICNGVGQPSFRFYGFLNFSSLRFCSVWNGICRLCWSGCNEAVTTWIWSGFLQWDCMSRNFALSWFWLSPLFRKRGCLFRVRQLKKRLKMLWSVRQGVYRIYKGIVVRNRTLIRRIINWWVFMGASFEMKKIPLYDFKRL